MFCQETFKQTAKLKVPIFHSDKMQLCLNIYSIGINQKSAHTIITVSAHICQITSFFNVWMIFNSFESN